MLGTSAAKVDLGCGGSLLVGSPQPLFTLPIVGGPGVGTASVAGTLAPVLAQVELFLQAIITSAASPCGLTATNAVRFAVL